MYPATEKSWTALLQQVKEMAREVHLGYFGLFHRVVVQVLAYTLLPKKRILPPSTGQIQSPCGMPAGFFLIPQPNIFKKQTFIIKRRIQFEAWTLLPAFIKKR
jgi:hypothetical protein